MLLPATASYAQQDLENVAAFARMYGVVRWFYPSDAAAGLDWDGFAVEGVRRVRGAGKPADLEDALRKLFGPLGPGIEIGSVLATAPPEGARKPELVAWFYRGPGLVPNASGSYSAKRFNRAMQPSAQLALLGSPGRIAHPEDSLEVPTEGAHVEFELARGIRARVPLSLTDSQARVRTPGFEALVKSIARTQPVAGRDDVDVRLADVVVAWSVFRHFYPYWRDIDVDWDAKLVTRLSNAQLARTSREAHINVLKSLVAELQDGHGSVRDTAIKVYKATLPLQLSIVEDKLVVIASGEERIPVGSVMKSINGTKVEALIAREMELASGTMQWKRALAERELALCAGPVRFTMETTDGKIRTETVSCGVNMSRVAATRPNIVAELQPGIVYVDLTRLRKEQLPSAHQALVDARGVVVDMRGYPTEAGAELLPLLMRSAEHPNDRWMHVPKYKRPFGEVAAYEDLTWSLAPLSAQVSARRIFLTDGRAISASESLMGYVKAYQLGTIIGGPTAGANGNVQAFFVPGGFRIAFTGMRVTGHDGTTKLHTVGILPDIPLAPTLAGIRAGRDELLERALQELGVRR
jgi:hypothetical protein